MRGSLRASERLLVVDLGEVRRLYTERGPRLARFVALVRGAPGPDLAARLLRHGLPPGETLVYPVAADLLDFEYRQGAVVAGGVAVFLEGPPPFVFTPYYAWVEGS